MTDSVYIEAKPAADLAAYIHSIWYRRVSPAEAEQPARILPDGCVDVIWVEHELIVAGPDTTAWTGGLASGDQIVGLRFQPGVAPALLGCPATELVGQRTPVSLVAREWACDLHRRTEALESTESIGEALQTSLRARLREMADVDRAVQHVVAAIRRSDDDVARVRVLADSVGLSERQLNRRCQDALGYGPKMLARIVRFQRFLELAYGPDVPIAQLAADCGYADQSHLTREVKELSGLPPAMLLAERWLLQGG